MSSWITVPALPDSMLRALRRKKQAAAPAKATPAMPAPVPPQKKPPYKVTAFYTGLRAEGPAGFLEHQAENPATEPQGPQSFDELASLIYQK
jgi:hypothetical protein